MAVKRVDRIGHFDARDSTGNSYRVIVFQPIMDGTLIHNNQRLETRGRKILHTEDGRHVNPVSKGVYEIVGVPNDSHYHRRPQRTVRPGPCPRCAKREGKLIVAGAGRFPFFVMCAACQFHTDHAGSAGVATKFWNEAKSLTGEKLASRKMRK